PAERSRGRVASDGEKRTRLYAAAGARGDGGTLMPATLITLDQAKRQLRETGTARDAEITDKMAQAENAILLYVKPLRTDEARDDWPWTIDTVPPVIQSAILIQLTNLDRNRGDALDDEDERAWQAIERLTAQLRDKALA